MPEGAMTGNKSPQSNFSYTVSDPDAEDDALMSLPEHIRRYIQFEAPVDFHVVGLVQVINEQSELYALNALRVYLPHDNKAVWGDGHPCYDRIKRAWLPDYMMKAK